MNRDLTRITVTPKCEKFIKSGHVWVYGEEITDISDKCENGDTVDVYTQKGKWLGAGFYNGNSKIAVRIISKNANDSFDEAFWYRRVKYAVEYRKTVMGADFDCCRIIFGESDGFPGLTVDKFNDVLVTEVLSLGTELIKDVIYKALIEVLKEYGSNTRVIYERNESPIREKEVLAKYKGFYIRDGLETETDGHVIITENSIKYDVDYINGQKTGFFLDQKYNRVAFARLAKGKTVLDCCTHTGAFALNAAAAGAASVTAVDISDDALLAARRNADLNSLTDKIDFVKSDMFDLLSELSKYPIRKFDLIILDPPAFTKSSSTVKSAYRGYKEVNTNALRALQRGGYFATCSCSHFMTEELFREMLVESARDAGVTLKEIEVRRQSPDHPILWGVPETAYLKFFLFQKI